MSAPKRLCLSERNIEALLANNDSSDEDDVVDNDSDDGEEDYLEEEVHLEDEEEAETMPLIPSNSDQVSPLPMNDYDSDDDTPFANLFFSKDKSKQVMKWKKLPPQPPNVRTRAENIIIHLPGSVGIARNVNTELEAFNLFFDDNAIRIIVTGTNIYISKIKERFARERDAKETDATEIRGFIGILILSGCLGSSRKKTKVMWNNSRGTGVESVYLCMSENRFHFLMRCIRFDNIRDRAERKEIDRLAAIREFFELIVHKFQTLYRPSEFCTIDEQLVKFRGRCTFKMYIPSKPGKYGVKVFVLVCAKSMYTVNLEVYVGRQPEGPYKLSQAAEDITLRLCEPIAGSNRNLTSDNWFTSIPLAEKLLSEKEVTLVGTIRSNRVGVPDALKPNKEREVHSSVFAHHKKKTLVSYCTKKNKCVLLLSTMHADQKIDEETEHLQKPEIVTLYNKTKVGVDVVDQMCEKYDVSRNTRRWPMVIFFDLINISAINASRILFFNHSNQDRQMPRREFLDRLAWELIQPQVRKRLETPSLPEDMKVRARKLLGIEEPQRQPQPVDNKVGRCYMCGRQRDKSTRKSCGACGKKICPEHSSLVCMACLN